ncbi:outer membrane protein, putative [Rhodovulum sp. P5]|uniref:outer membrane protein n=1 Tax=Rhodovulum sp. P5 TaxID=1564506 RepID=UPI0009C2E3E9|nr:outer membrane beta-barrel protein [Rhodovulum sp. P5]ARE38879.1 outer membrane protein, putative [Rhodovulum sp. P5]
MRPHRKSVLLALGLAAVLAMPAAAEGTGAAEEGPVLSYVGSSGTGGDWQGSYAGIQFVYSDLDSASGDDDRAVTGFHAGYRWDLGRHVMGIEVDYARPDLTVMDEDIDHVLRLKGQYGFDFGRTMAYATAGAATAETSLGEGTGVLLGAGVDFSVTPSFVLGAEVTYQDFDEFGNSGTGADATTAGLRASFRF